MTVRYARLHGLYAVLCAGCGTWLAGLLTEANREAYVARNGWEVLG